MKQSHDELIAFIKTHPEMYPAEISSMTGASKGTIKRLRWQLEQGKVSTWGYKCIGERGCKYVGTREEFTNKHGQMQCPKCGKTHTFLVVDLISDQVKK